MSKTINIIFICAVLVFGFMYQDVLKNVWTQSLMHYFPCKRPITYSIATFDTKFGISEEDFLTALWDAENVWEKTIDKDLFKRTDDGSLKINLIYDVRQESTEKLKETGVVVEKNKASYDSLKLKYDTLISEYNQEKRVFENRVNIFEARKAKYEAEVTAVNKKGGANKQTYERLNAEKNYLAGEIIIINQLQAGLNQKVGEINTLTKTLNELAVTLNLNVKKFNNIGGSLGSEFEEGTYTRDINGQRIDIYQFESRSKLVRVLAHELGHALGLEHVEDTKAIMYRLNNGINEKPTESDITELKSLCGVPA